MNNKIGKHIILWIWQHFNEFVLDNNDDDSCDSNKNHMQKHNTFLSKYLTWNDQFKDILIYHDTGTGKTMEA